MNLPLPAIKLSLRDRPNQQSAALKAIRIRRVLFLRLFLGIALALILCPVALPQQSSAPAMANVTDIVRQLVSHNQQREHDLGAYTSRRHYHVAYLGFPHATEADMVVDVTCSGPISESFELVSQSGSHLLLDHVLSKLLKTEQDASRDRTGSALTPANYTFTLLRTEMDGERPTYVLTVEPKQRRSLLYRGTIWVDAQDYAVVRIEAEPAKNPSFWIRDTQIDHVYEKTGDFWLPQSNRSETKVRLGGKAILTIDYSDYRFVRPEALQTAAVGSEE